MMKDDVKRAMVATFLREQTTLSLATVDELGMPAVAPLYYIADDRLTLYWLSSPGSQHSANLLRTPRAAVTVYRPSESWREICGVQMRGEVAAVTDPLNRRVLVGQYRERFKLGALFSLPIAQSTLYAFRPELFRYIDNSRHFGFRFELAADQA